MLFGLDRALAKFALKRVFGKYLKGEKMPTQGKVRFWGTIAATVAAVILSVVPSIGVDPSTVQSPSWVASVAYGFAVLFQLLKKDK